MHGGCGHHHDHDHHHEIPQDAGKAFILGIILNVLFIIAEIIFGLRANSLSLLGDAVHNFSDVIGLGMAFAAVLFARQDPSPRFTYGLQGASIIAALGNGILLLVVTGGLGWQAIMRLLHPEPAMGATMMAVAAFGVVINGLSAALFIAGRKNDLNIRAAFTHQAADAVLSLGVVIAGFLVMRTGWLWLDPIVSLLLAAAIIVGTWNLLRDSGQLALQAVPRQIDPAAVRAHLLALPGVTGIHDLHIWATSTTETALSTHLLMPAGHPGNEFLQRLAEDLTHRFNIGHTTVQIEVGDSSAACELASRHPA